MYELDYLFIGSKKPNFVKIQDTIVYSHLRFFFFRIVLQFFIYFEKKERKLDKYKKR